MSFSIPSHHQVTYDTEEAEPSSLASVPNLKKVLAEGEEEGNEEPPPEAAGEEEEEVAEEEEAEELDDEGNPIPRAPVLYDTGIAVYTALHCTDTYTQTAHYFVMTHPCIMRTRAL